MHIVLLGDSIFDNGSYTKGRPDVVTQVRQLFPEGWRATILAVDGSMVGDVPSHLRRLPQGSTHLVLSAGGNDALRGSGILETPASSVTDALLTLAGMSQTFEANYRSTVAACMQMSLPLILCTIYNGRFPDRNFQRIASTALMVFNDVILRVAIEFRLSVIDLRFVCSDPADYANPIEPS
ncbi:MAG TPA: SGNH/GDSL hydrolase family protein, partial [Candidatus Angelobacter sp.]|nr:SGNH/GDSL hydrolase family protein [Candidatus Angelobacter sp.]